MFFLYLDVQLQEAQVPQVSIREYANIFTLCDGEIHGFAWQYWNSRALDL